MLTLADISAQAFPYLNLCAAFVIEAVSLCRKCSDTGLNFGWLLVVMHVLILNPGRDCPKKCSNQFLVLMDGI